VEHQLMVDIKLILIYVVFLVLEEALLVVAVLLEQAVQEVQEVLVELVYPQELAAQQ
jgi:hypothetical protein